jgi:DnaJ family protein A protein 5
MNEQDESYITKTKLKPFMQNSCHRGFDHKLEDNFFKVYDKLFRQLDREEELEEQVGTKHQSYPVFGDYNASAEEVFAFYENW